MRRSLPLLLLIGPAASAAELLHLEFNDPAHPLGDASPYHHPMTNITFTDDIITGTGVVVQPGSGTPAGGGAAWFDGGSALEFPATDTMEHTTAEPFTVRLWFCSGGITRSPAYGTRYSNRMHILGFGAGSGGTGNFDLDLDDSDNQVGLWTYWNGNGSPHTWSGPGSWFTYTDATWYEYWYTWDGAVARNYVRPEGGAWALLEETPYASTIGSAVHPNRIGAAATGSPTLGYQGWLDSLIIYDAALSPDLCPGTPGMDTADRDGDLIGDACDMCLGDNDSGDTDADRVCDDIDNCGTTPNPDQADFDTDGTGDRCEADVYFDLDGTCPGPITATIAHLVPGGHYAVVRSATAGSITVPGGPCAGTALGLGAPASLVATLTTPPSGQVTLNPTFGSPACGKYLQIVDLANCHVSAVIQAL